MLPTWQRVAADIEDAACGGDVKKSEIFKNKTHLTPFVFVNFAGQPYPSGWNNDAQHLIGRISCMLADHAVPFLNSPRLKDCGEINATPLSFCASLWAFTFVRIFMTFLITYSNLGWLMRSGRSTTLFS
jgi:hypothetical protein